MKKLIIRASAAMLGLWLLFMPVTAVDTLVPGGQVVGLQLTNDTVTVAAFDDTLGGCAREAGLQIGDEILNIDGTAIDSARDVRLALERSDGQISVSILRKDREHQLCLTPQITEHGPRLGVYLRQGVTGLGTVTWYDPESGRFATLGHGIHTAAGDLVPMTDGRVFGANVLSVKKGVIGKPGQLRGGISGSQPLGSIEKNTPQGVFGNGFSCREEEAIPVADTREIRTGAATIRSTVSGSSVQEYSVEILKIYPTGKTAGRNMLLKIKDPALINTTGGIVQGMSGSPIIQDGKLIGAVTHVLVNDPTTGYGIFIENMLDAAA